MVQKLKIHLLVTSHNTPEPNMAHAGINHLRLAGSGPVAQTIIGCTEI
jgi:hypothetical protein